MATVQVTDDGPGGAQVKDGGGLQGLKDRIEALGGHFAVSSGSAGGTVVNVSVPLAGTVRSED